MGRQASAWNMLGATCPFLLGRVLLPLRVLLMFLMPRLDNERWHYVRPPR
jgi:hypothetical protein